MKSIVLAVTVAAVAFQTCKLLLSDPQRAVDFYEWVNTFDDCTQYNKEKHYYLNGPFKPVHEENYHLPTKIISGAIPSDLRGMFMRIGPNPSPHKIAHGYHWFDGKSPLCLYYLNSDFLLRFSQVMV
jgi:hypothetical protein